jgi:putative thioredoxin
MANFDFERDVIVQSKQLPVLVDFWAEWCGPCRILGPVLERLAAASVGRFKLVKVDTDAYPEVAARYGVSSIPAVKLFKDGVVAGEFVGALPEREVARFLDAYLPSESQQLVAAASAALASGERAKAERLLEAALKQEPTLWEARVRLAELRFRRDPKAALELVQDVPPNDPSATRIEALRALASLLERARAHTPPPEGVPAELWERYLDGARAFAAGRDTDALDAWIEVLRRRRELDDDGPRRACVALFGLLGDDSDVTREYRRKFTSALY